VVLTGARLARRLPETRAILVCWPDRPICCWWVRLRNRWPGAAWFSTALRGVWSLKHPCLALGLDAAHSAL